MCLKWLKLALKSYKYWPVFNLVHLSLKFGRLNIGICTWAKHLLLWPVWKGKKLPKLFPTTTAKEAEFSSRVDRWSLPLPTKPKFSSASMPCIQPKMSSSIHQKVDFFCDYLLLPHGPTHPSCKSQLHQIQNIKSVTNRTILTSFSNLIPCIKNFAGFTNITSLICAL